MRVSNVEVYGLRESIRGAKFPMSTDTDKITTVLTNGVKALAQSEKGEGHDQWLTGVIVQFDLTAPLKMWVEAERYQFLHFVSSQSTMHRITRFDIDAQCNEYVDERVKEVMRECVARYNISQSQEDYLKCLFNVPAGFCLTARMTTNYRQLKTIYSQRRTHRLPDWREFCLWIETLPMAFLITNDKDEVEDAAD